MNKKIKKTLAVTMATASTMAMAIPGVAFAAPGDVPSDAKTVNVRQCYRTVIKSDADR